MKIITEKSTSPIHAIQCLLTGLKLLGKAELRKFLLIPILINIILFSIAIGLGYFYIADLVTQFIPSWLGWLEWFIWPLFFMSFSAITFFTFAIVANLIAAPFYSQLSVKTLELISGTSGNTINQKTNQVLWAEIKRMGYLISRMLPLLVLFIIPGINLIAPFLWALFAAWGLGLEFMAYPLENKGLLFSEQKQQAKTRRLSVISFGGLTMIGLSIPILNLVVAPAAVIGATVYFHNIAETS